MTELAGKVAMLRLGGYIKAKTISFTATSTISDSEDGFILAGFVSGDKITVSGSDDNDGTYTISDVTDGTITVSETSIVNENAGAEITIETDAPGNIAYGIKDWQISYNCDVAEITDFGSEGNKEYIATNKYSALTAGGFWDTSGNEDIAVGYPRKVYIFTKYTDSPSAINPAYYYEGVGHLNGFNTSHNINEVVTKSVTVTCDGSLTFNTKTSSW